MTDIPDNVDRHTENDALRIMAIEGRLAYRTRNTDILSWLHSQIVRLERAIMQHLPYLDNAERLQLIAHSSGLTNVSPTQLEGLLEQASDILMLQELRGKYDPIEDMTAYQVERLWHQYSRPVKTRRNKRA